MDQNSWAKINGKLRQKVDGSKFHSSDMKYFQQGGTTWNGM